MSVTTFEGIVEYGQVRLPEKARVCVVVPDVNAPPVAYVGSPPLAHPEQAADFCKEVVEDDDGLRR